MLPTIKDLIIIFPRLTPLGAWEKYYCCQDTANILLNRECLESFSKASAGIRWAYPSFEFVYLFLTRIFPCIVLLQIFKFGAIKSQKKNSQVSSIDAESVEGRRKKEGSSSGKTTNIS